MEKSISLSYVTIRMNFQRCFVKFFFTVIITIIPVKTSTFKVKFDSNEGNIMSKELSETVDVDTYSRKTDNDNPVLIVKIKNGWPDVNEINKGNVIAIPLVILKIINADKFSHMGNIARKNEQTKEGQLKKEKRRKEHQEKLRQIINFMANKRRVTDYFYSEVQRIKRDNVVKDELRIMVSFLERPENEDMKRTLLNYYRFNLTNVNKKTPTIWDHRPNELVINVLKDPFNDGVAN